MASGPSFSCSGCKLSCCLAQFASAAFVLTFARRLTPHFWLLRIQRSSDTRRRKTLTYRTPSLLPMLQVAQQQRGYSTIGMLSAVSINPKFGGHGRMPYVAQNGVCCGLRANFVAEATIIANSSCRCHISVASEFRVEGLSQRPPEIGSGLVGLWCKAMAPREHLVIGSGLVGLWRKTMATGDIGSRKGRGPACGEDSLGP